MAEVVGIHLNKLEANHFAHLPALNSAWHTLLNPETGQVSEIKARSPNTKVLARPYVRDQDYHARYLQGNPVEAGQWAAGVVASQRGRNPNADAWIVLNEPPCDTVEQVERLAQADIAYMRALEAQGLKAGIGAFSTGNLQIPRFDSARQVRAYEPAFRHAAANGHYLVIHCYAAARPMMGGATPSGWVHEPRYFGLRWHEEIFPYMRANGIPIPLTIIAECGKDLGFAKKFGGYTGQFVGYRVPEPWGYGDSEAGARRYVNDLVPFVAELAKDSEVVGVCLYCAGDNGDEKWRSFMMDGVMGYLASKTFPFPTQPQQPPAPPTGTIMIDLPSNHYSSRQGQRVKYIILHSTATPVGGTLESTANYLKQNERGVSIHELVGANIVYKMVADSNAAHHAESETARLPGGEPNYLNNELTWGIEAFQIADTPVAPLVARTMLERVVEACRRLGIPSSRVLAHREIDPMRRSDPVGVNMVQFRQAVATALGEGQAPPDANPFLLQIKQRQEIANNPGTAFMRAARALGYYNSLGDEVYGQIGGRNTVGQLFANVAGEERIFWAYAGEWGNIQNAPVPQQAVA